MTVQMLPEGTASQQASAELHLERQAEWRYYRVDGVRYVALPSGNSGKVYRVRADGAGCSCKWYAEGHPICAHMIAVRRLNERPAIREVRGRFEALFPSCVDCNDLADGSDGRCSKCASDREFSQRQAARAAARRG